jgi:hypothetical protein
MAGKAIGHSLRTLLFPVQVPGDLVIVFSHIACLYIWWLTFRQPDSARCPRPE